MKSITTTIILDKVVYSTKEEAVTEAQMMIAHYGYSAIRILSETGKCIKIVKKF